MKGADMTDPVSTDPPGIRPADAPSPARKPRRHLPLILAIVAAAALLGWEFRDLLLGSDALVFLLLFACLGMHFFMHRGHGRHGPGDPNE